MSLSPKVWKLIAESRIEQSIREGGFDNLPGFGQPLDFDSMDMSEHWWLKQKANQENLSVLPPALELKRDVQQACQRIMQLDSEQTVRNALNKLNEHIRAANMRILWGPPSQVLPVDVDDFLSLWKSR